MTEKEMTLDEWCERLHPAHLVNRQLVALKKNIKLEDYEKWAEPIALAGVKGCLDAAEEENIRLNARIEELEQLVLDTLHGNFKQICSYCGWSSKEGEWDELQEHIRNCDKHPLTRAEVRIKELEAKLAERTGGE